MDWLDLIVMEQVSLWDDIIPSKERAKFLIHTTNKYRFIDQVSLWYLALFMCRPELFLIHTTNKYRFIDQVSLWYLALLMCRPELSGLCNKLVSIVDTYFRIS